MVPMFLTFMLFASSVSLAMQFEMVTTDKKRFKLPVSILGSSAITDTFKQDFNDTQTKFVLAVPAVEADLQLYLKTLEHNNKNSVVLADNLSVSEFLAMLSLNVFFDNQYIAKALGDLFRSRYMGPRYIEAFCTYPNFLSSLINAGLTQSMNSNLAQSLHESITRLATNRYSKITYRTEYNGSVTYAEDDFLPSATERGNQIFFTKKDLSNITLTKEIDAKMQCAAYCHKHHLLFVYYAHGGASVYNTQSGLLLCNFGQKIVQNYDNVLSVPGYYDKQLGQWIADFSLIAHNLKLKHLYFIEAVIAARDQSCQLNLTNKPHLVECSKELPPSIQSFIEPHVCWYQHASFGERSYCSIS